MAAISDSQASRCQRTPYNSAMQTSRITPLWPVLAVLGSITLLAVGTSWAKHLFPLIGAEGTSALRVGFSALLLMLLWRAWRWPLARADAWTVVRYGLALGLMNLLFYMAIGHIPFAIAVAIQMVGPLAVVLISSRRGMDFVWAGCALAGLALLLPLRTDAPLDPVGVMYALMASTCWALYIVFGKRAGHLHAGHSVSLGLATAALVVVPVGVVHAGAALLDWKILLAGLVVAVVSSALPISLEMMALKRLPRHTFGILLSAEPAAAALWAWLLLGEQLSLVQWFAIACMIAASAGASMNARGLKMS